ncbi:MAG: DUF4397 domain-containing protein [Lachnospiraceae bacterium]|nr:DUF4397 domain-containing protein [Lachnospiraceae bacterium]
MPDTTNINTPATANENGAATAVWNDPAGIPTTPIAPPGGFPVFPGDDIAGIPTTPIAPPGGPPAYPGDDIAGIPTTPIAPPGGFPVYPGDDIAGIPTTPIAPPPGSPGNSIPAYPGNNTPSITWPCITCPTPSLPTVTYYGQVRFLNATTNGLSLDVFIDGRSVFSGSSFATVSSYSQVSDGFHTVTVQATRGQIYYQQSLGFVAGEKVTMVILDAPNGVTLARVSDMGCTNLSSGYGCLRVANMSYSGSNYDVRLFNNQIAFSNVGYKEVTSFKQASAGNYTFFVTNAQTASFSTFGELPVIVFSALIGNCSSCSVSNPVLTYSINVQPGKTYTSYIIGNTWSNLFRVYTLED